MDEKMLTTEEVEMGTEYPTLHFPVRLTMVSKNHDAKFEFTTSVDEVGQIILTPTEKDVEFTGAHTEWESNDYIMPTEDVSEIIDDVLIVEKTIELTASLAQENENQKINAIIDDIGQCVIYPEEKENTFITASVDNSLNLATTGEPVVVEDVEETTDTVEEEPTMPTKDEVTAEVISESTDRETLFKDKINEFSTIIFQACKTAEELISFCKEFGLDGSYIDILNHFIENTFYDDFQPHHLLTELGENTDFTEAVIPADDEPYDFDHVKHDLRIITDYFSDESGAVRCGFEIEKKYGVQILSRYYNNVETDFDGTWYTITFSGLKHSDLTEDIDNTKAQLCLTVLNDIKSDLQDVAEKLVKVEDYFEDLGITDTDVDSIFLRDIEHMIENPNGDVSVTQLISRVEELIPPVTEEIIEEDLDEVDKLNILTRFRQGDLSVFYDEGMPTDGLERLFDADSETSEYYYDPASDAIVYFNKN